MPIPFIQQTLSPFTPPIHGRGSNLSHSHNNISTSKLQYNTVAALQPQALTALGRPSLTHSAPSTSDDDNESDAGRSVAELTHPSQPRWLYGEMIRRQYEASPSSKPVDIPRIVVPSYTAPSRASSRAPSQAPSRASSRASSPRSASPPTSLPSLPSAPVSDLEKIIENIEDIEYQINARVLEFTFPSILDFGERFPNGEFPPLPYTVRNKSLIEHRDYLEKSLLSMDEIQSFGDSRVKCTRKRVVTKIEEQLEQLNRMEKMVRDNMHYERWKKTPRIQVTAPPGST
ncbi:hypothetical protein RHS01_02129 [Rhizoctonia solani]|uniref:BAG domain-containing protein n=1 Tax=Rhizoctonia solani TaxID=456999 RepID=A0A8H7M881_9AGAM|nr:hypothetical protein RHS01_02129 [Rhizoctonia solani]